jgi:lysophospholipase L1-like esterase
VKRLFAAIVLGVLTTLPASSYPWDARVSRETPLLEFNELTAGDPIPAGTELGVPYCLDEPAVCSVTYEGTEGWVKADDLVTNYGGQTLPVLDAEKAWFIDLLSADTADNPDARDIVAWGDSLTGGYPEIAAELVTGRDIVGHGFGGESSTKVKARFLEDTETRNRVHWIWVGRNNYREVDKVLADIAEMVASLPHNRYLVGGVLNGDWENEWKDGADYAVLQRLNNRLRAIYEERFVDLHAALMAVGAAADDIEHDVPPAAVRQDQIHLNEVGQRAVADAWIAKTEELGF